MLKDRNKNWLIVTGYLAMLAVIRSVHFEDRDPYWQVREGLERLRGVPLERPDSWSYASTVGLFRPTSPGWNTLQALGWEVGMETGLYILWMISIGSYLLLAMVVARRLGSRPFPFLIAGGVMLLLGLPMLSPRATLFVQTLSLATLLILDTGHRKAAQSSSLRLVAASAVAYSFLVGWFGSWIHISWSVLGPFLACLFAFIYVIVQQPALRQGMAVGASSLIGMIGGVLAGPYGLSVRQLNSDISVASRGVVTEWMSPLEPSLAARWLPALATAVLVAILGIWVTYPFRRVGPRAENAPLFLSLAIAGLAAAAFGMLAIRFIGISLLWLTPVGGALLSQGGAQWRLSRPFSGSPGFRHRMTSAYWRPIFATTLIVLAPLAIVSIIFGVRPSPELTLIRSLPPNCRLFADPSVTALSLFHRPDIEVWVDMRTEVYGLTHLLNTQRRLTQRPAVPLPSGTSCAIVDSSAWVVSDSGSGEWVPVATAGPYTQWLKP